MGLKKRLENEFIYEMESSVPPVLVWGFCETALGDGVLSWVLWKLEDFKNLLLWKTANIYKRGGECYGEHACTYYLVSTLINMWPVCFVSNIFLHFWPPSRGQFEPNTGQEEWFLPWSPQKGVRRERSWESMTKTRDAEETEDLLGEWLLSMFGKGQS